MNIDPIIHQAVQNNAIWCEIVCRTHGIPGEFHDVLWLNTHPVPLFYPHAVTLMAGAEALQIARIEALCASGSTGRISVKDSFATLDLAPLGFTCLFEASWIWRSAGLPMPVAVAPQLRWERLHEPEQLAAWEQAWSGNAEVPGDRIFVPELLADQSVAVIALYPHEPNRQDEQIIAGAIANQSGDVVGLSNLFGSDLAQSWAGCIQATQAIFPGRDLVGYESGADLAFAQAQGFLPLAPLRVWLQDV